MCGDTRLELASTQFQPGTLELPYTHTHTLTSFILFLEKKLF